MAAYGSLVSVMQILDQIQHHPHPPISLDKTQVETLTENIIFLQEFLESYSLEFGYRQEADPLEMRIADAAYAAEDIIESHIVDQIHAQSSSKNISFIKRFQGLWKSTCCKNEGSPTDKFYKSLQKVIDAMDLLKKEVMDIKEKAGVRDQLLRNTMTAGSFRSSAGQNTTMVGFDDELLEIMDKLTGGQCDREIISIVGMGGTGKTTLARNIYQHQVVVQHFHFCAWATISQEYRIRECLLELLEEGAQNLSELNEHELGDQLHKSLFGRRYLIIIDDIWDIKVWDHLRRFFPDNKNGSRIVITTRISNFESTGSYVLKMGFLDIYRSWSLFSNIVFEEEGCPLELEEIGMKIVDNCRGLPLSIVVVGGLLAKSRNTREYWESLAENLNSIVNSENDERCLKILHMSYNQLPVYLKSCFLYMGVFPEDRKIRVSELIKLWVAEGFLKPISGSSLEEVADEYLQELINRNLVLAHEVGSIGKVKYCKIHDLLRDLCLRQAGKERFYNVIQHFKCHLLKERFYNVIRHCCCHVPQDTSTRCRRIVIPEHTFKNNVIDALQIKSPARTLIYDCYSLDVIPLHSLRLLRIMFFPYYDNRSSRNSPDDVFRFVNSRCVVLRCCRNSPAFTSSSYKLWNLQTLITKSGVPTGLIDIWNMPQLRHLNLGDGFHLPALPTGDDGIVLANLQTLCPVFNFNCSEELAKRIPNIKKLKTHYSRTQEEPGDYCANFGLLDKLESLTCWQMPGVNGRDIPQNLSFPNSLKKLTLQMCTLWEDKLEKVGSLPLLQKFKLIGGIFRGGKWATVEGQFPSLKFLLVVGHSNLKHWETEYSHFPRLEHLVLSSLEELEEIPCEIGEIATLKSIRLSYCSPSASKSAKKITEKQEELFGEVVVRVLVNGQRIVSLASPNSESE